MFRSLPPSPTPIKGAPVPRLSAALFRRVFKLTATRYVDLARAVHLRPGQPIYFAPSGNRGLYWRQVGPSNLEMCSYATRARIHLPFEKGHGGPTRRAKKCGGFRRSTKPVSSAPTSRRFLGFRIAHGSSAV